jgi:hypothetical protein
MNEVSGENFLSFLVAPFLSASAHQLGGGAYEFHRFQLLTLLSERSIRENGVYSLMADVFTAFQ